MRLDFGDVEYSIPAEPFRAVLHVSTAASDDSARSVTLYGDGSLDLVDGVQGAFTHAIGRAELERLVGDAVGHGLLELNRMATQSMERMMMTEDGAAIRWTAWMSLSCWLLRWMHEQFAAAERVFDEGSDLQSPPTSRRPMGLP